MNKLRLAIVSCCFLGCSPFAPGTVGTLGGVAIAWALKDTGAWFPVWVILLCAVFYAVGRPLGDWAEQYAGKKDPGIYVLDEVIGYLVTVLWCSGPSLTTLVVAFFVFRFSFSFFFVFIIFLFLFRALFFCCRREMGPSISLLRARGCQASTGQGKSPTSASISG